MPITIREPTWDEKGKLRAFYGTAYRPNHPLTSERFVIWLLHDNPCFEGKNFSCKIAVDGSAIVGHYAYIPVGVWVAGKVIRGQWGANLFVNPAYRRQGIASRLIDAFAQDTDIALDIGASPVVKGIMQERGWVHFGTLLRYVGVVDAAGAKILASDPEAVSQCMIERGSSRPDTSLKVERADRFSDDSAVFWNEYRQGVLYAAERSPAYLNWRYVSHPAFRYDLFQIRDKQRVKGIGVVRIESVKGTESSLIVARIVEFLAFPEYQEPFLGHIVGYARDQGAALIDFFCSSRRYGTAYEKFGFRSSPIADKFARLFSPLVHSKGPIGLSGISVSKDVDSNIFSWQEQWYATTGDGDQDRPNTDAGQL